MLMLLLRKGADIMAQNVDGVSGLELLRYHHVGRYITFYTEVMEDHASLLDAQHALRSRFKAANGVCLCVIGM